MAKPRKGQIEEAIKNLRCFTNWYLVDDLMIGNIIRSEDKFCEEFSKFLIHFAEMEELKPTVTREQAEDNLIAPPFHSEAILSIVECCLSKSEIPREHVQQLIEYRYQSGARFNEFLKQWR